MAKSRSSGASVGNSASVSRDVESYRILFGDRALANLRKRGANDQSIANVYRDYGNLRSTGMSKTEARMTAEKQNMVNAVAPKTTKSAKTTPDSARNTRKTSNFVNGYGEATTREITSTAYKNSQNRIKKQIGLMFRNR